MTAPLSCCFAKSSCRLLQVITSLVTGVPVVVTERFLRSYTFLSEEHVVLQESEDEAIMDAAVRLLRFSSKELAKIRSGIDALRESLNKRAADQIKIVVDSTDGRKDLGPLPRIEIATATEDSTTVR